MALQENLTHHIGQETKHIIVNFTYYESNSQCLTSKFNILVWKPAANIKKNPRGPKGRQNIEITLICFSNMKVMMSEDLFKLVQKISNNPRSMRWKILHSGTAAMTQLISRIVLGIWDNWQRTLREEVQPSNYDTSEHEIRTNDICLCRESNHYVYATWKI